MAAVVVGHAAHATSIHIIGRNVLDASLRLSGPMFLNTVDPSKPGIPKITVARFRAGQNHTKLQRKRVVGPEIAIDVQPQWGWVIGRDLSLALASPCRSFESQDTPASAASNRQTHNWSTPSPA